MIFHENVDEIEERKRKDNFEVFCVDVRWLCREEMKCRNLKVGTNARKHSNRQERVARSNSEQDKFEQPQWMDRF